MSVSADDARRAVRDRAGDRCEYCRLPQRATRVRHVIDHVIARQHGGEDDPSNLAWCCQRCNLHKGPNIAGVDGDPPTLVRLFDPRRDAWGEHFAIDRERIVARTAIGRATAHVLQLNADYRLSVRRELVDEGLWP